MANMEDNNRLIYLDYIKGIAVILVVFGHCSEIYSLSKIICSFHMPLFFLISGYLIAYKDIARSGFFDFLKKKFIRIMGPYFAFEIANFIISFILLKSGASDSFVMKFPYAIWDILICLDDAQNYMGVAGRLWFFPCIFLSYIASYWIVKLYHGLKNRIGKKKYAQNVYFLIAAGIFFILSYLEHKIAGDKLLWFCADRALMGTSFVLLGAAFKPLLDELFKLKLWIKAILFVLCIAVNLACVHYNYVSFVLMFKHVYGNHLLFLIGALAGSLATALFVSLVYKILPEKPFVFLSKNSGNMFGVQFAVMYFFGWLVSLIFSFLPDFTYVKEVSSMVKFVLSLLLSMLVCWAINKITNLCRKNKKSSD